MNSYPEVEVDHDALKKMIDKKWLGMTNIVKLDEEPAVKAGENYGSIMRRLRIKVVGPGGDIVNRTIVMKKGHQLPQELKENFDIFKCEIQMYCEVLPKMKEIIDQTENKGDLQVMWAECCGARHYDVILLEDLTASGHIMRNRRVPISPELTVHIGGRLGQFHALSLAAISRKMVVPSTLTPNRFLSNNKLLNCMFSGGLITLADSLESSWGQEWHSAVPKLRDLASKVGTELQRLGEKVKDKFSVINHGDCWSNNIMFKYSEDSAKDSLPSSLRFVDYQLSHYSCFAWDLTYILHTSTSANIRSVCYEPFMEHYRNSLVETLRLLGEDVSQVPDLEWMHTVMKEMNLFSLMAAFSLFPVTINTLEKAWDLDDSFNETGNSHGMEMYKNPIVIESLKLDLVRFKNEGLL